MQHSWIIKLYANVYIILFELILENVMINMEDSFWSEDGRYM